MKRQVAGAVLALVLLGCSESMTTAPGNGDGGGGGGGTPPPPPPPPPPPVLVLLRDVVIPSLPSPYYHFEYDSTGRLSAASFASGFTMYEVVYRDGRISELRNNALGNQDRLVYTYDDAGRVSEIRYVDPRDVVFTRVSLAYQGEKLIGLERRRLHGDSLLLNKVMSFTYYPDGNLERVTDHRPFIDSLQTEGTTTDLFEQYDNKTNVDGFGLLHNDFFDHLVLLPGVTLQKGNPGRVTHTGDGVHYREDRVYQYDEQGRPRNVTGDLVLLNGPDEGTHVSTGTQFSYY